MCFFLFLWLSLLTAGRRVLALTRVCNSTSPCIGQLVECTDASDCVFDCVDEGVCANSSLFCSQSATGECHVHCLAPESCRGATLESQRDSTVQCSAEFSCLRMEAAIGKETANLSLAVSCDAPHSCFHSRFQLHSEGGAATVQCADLGTNGTHTCEDLSLVCGMSETGNCEAASGGGYACDGADANRLLCANSALCTADADCFTLLETATVSFLISNGPLNTSDECVAGVQLAAGSELPADGLLACVSLNAAIAKCKEMTQTGALKQWANGVGIGLDLSNAVADSCEFLFATFDDSQPLAVAATSQLAVDYEYGFEARFYPWQHSANSALRNAIAESGALNTTKVRVAVSAPFLTVADVAVDAFFQLRALNFTAVSQLSAPLIAVTNAPHTSVQISGISVNQIETSANLLHFEGGAVDVVGSEFIGGAALDSSVVYCFDCALAVDSCRFVDGSNDAGALHLESNSRLSFTHSICAGNNAAKGACIDAQNSDVSLENSAFVHNSATVKGGAVYVHSDASLFAASPFWIGFCF